MTKLKETLEIGNTGKTLANAIEIEDSGIGYIKYSDGTMICYQTITGAVNITAGMGSLYRCRDEIVFPSFPKQFIEIPVVSVNITATTDYIFWFGTSLYGEPTINSAGKYWLWRPNSASDVHYKAQAIAIGKWK